MPNEETIVRGIITLIETLPTNKELKANVEKQITGQNKKGKNPDAEVDWQALFSWNVSNTDQRIPAPNTYMVLAILHDSLVYEHPSVARVAAAAGGSAEE